MTPAAAVSIATSSSVWFGQSQLASNQECRESSLWFPDPYSARNTKRRCLVQVNMEKSTVTQ